MFKIEQKPFGAQFAFAETVSADEMKQWASQAEQLLSHLPSGFGVLVDNRNLPPGGICPKARRLLRSVQARYRRKGMGRSCVVLNSGAATLQQLQADLDANEKQIERFVNAAAHPDWEQAALAWLNEGVEPD